MDKLQRQQSALTAASKIFMRESQQMLAVELHLTALNAKTEPERELVAEFSRALSEEPHEAIQWAFRTWREKSPFFPALCELRTLIATWHRDRYHETVTLREKREKRELDAARGRGELIAFPDLLKKLAEVAKKMP